MLRGQRFHVYQGDEERGHVGFVRPGRGVDFVSEEDDLYHSVQGRGAGFFARTLPECGSAAHVPLSSAGVVELSSADRWLVVV